ncbi:endoplasmic reticulum protein [Infundibulicybe gibba]|nr:endoplasmic reticulum protein [Infundibulicybe gibba]
MTIYYSLTFLLLATEMVTFCLLVSPLPYTVRKKLFRFLAESPIVAKVAYALKISFIFVAILFADALQRMFRVTAEAEAAKSGGHPAADVRTETNFAARKFYSQRNTYLTGFTLFLSLVLTRTFYIILDLIHTQEEYAKLKKIQGSDKGSAGEVAVLKKKLQEHEATQRDFETLKKQAAQQAAEFDRLATKYNEATGTSTKGEKKKNV